MQRPAFTTESAGRRLGAGASVLLHYRDSETDAARLEAELNAARPKSAALPKRASRRSSLKRQKRLPAAWVVVPIKQAVKGNHPSKTDHQSTSWLENHNGR